MKKISLGIIIGNREFFPDHLVSEARNDIMNLFDKLKINPIILSNEDTKLGGVETFKDAEKCANLFRSANDIIDGVVVILPNFGDT